MHSSRMSDLVHCFELDRRELTEGALTPAVGAFDAEDDRQPELPSAAPAATVEHVVLKQREERLHGSVARAGPGAAHRADQAFVPEKAHELPRPELAAA